MCLIDYSHLHRYYSLHHRHHGLINDHREVIELAIRIKQSSIIVSLLVPVQSIFTMYYVRVLVVYQFVVIGDETEKRGKEEQRKGSTKREKQHKKYHHDCFDVNNMLSIDSSLASYGSIYV